MAPSSTTTLWPLIARVDHDANGFVNIDGTDITVQQDSVWDEVVEEILRDRAELWKRLANS